MHRVCTLTQKPHILERPHSAGISPCHDVSTAWRGTGGVAGRRVQPLPFPHQEETMLVWAKIISHPAAAPPQRVLSGRWGTWLSHSSAALPHHQPKLSDTMRGDTPRACCCSQHGQKPTERVSGTGSCSHQARAEPPAPAVWRLQEEEAWHVEPPEPAGNPVTPALSLVVTSPA